MDFQQGFSPLTAFRFLTDFIRHVLFEAVKVSIPLFKIMVPILIVVKVLQEVGGITLLGRVLAPVMSLVGLPGDAGLVWATAMVNTIYGAIVVFVTLAPGMELSTAQITVLCTMILVAHSLPVELQIARKAGTNIWFQFCVRFFGALVLGIILDQVYTAGGRLQEPGVILWQSEAGSGSTWLAWSWEQVVNLAYIFLIVLALVALMRIFDLLKITQLLIRLLGPVLSMLGIGRSAAPITIVGMVLGLGYGGGLIIREARSGRVGHRDVFFALTLMGLSHSIFEDTLLMMVLGAHVSGLLWARVAFTLAVVFILVRLTGRMGNSAFRRFLGRPCVEGDNAEPAVGS